MGFGFRVVVESVKEGFLNQALCAINAHEHVKAFKTIDGLSIDEIKHAINICHQCPCRQACALQALHSGASLDERYESNARDVVQAGIICNGGSHSAQQLAEIAGVSVPKYRKHQPRPKFPTNCRCCGTSLHRFTKRPESIPNGMVMHYARGYCVNCRKAYKRGLKASRQTKQEHSRN